MSRVEKQDSTFRGPAFDGHLGGHQGSKLLREKGRNRKLAFYR
jgi:hypothetical protein